MVGQVVALEPRAYEEWLSGAGEAGAATQPSTGSLADAGRRIFASLGCATCHAPAPEVEARGRGPSLAGLFGKEVELADGRTVRADESYIRESIIDPGAKLVAGYQPLMPSFRGVVDEEGLIALLAYIRSLNPPAPAAAPPATTAPERPSP
jgi:cytochrome c oxidase subunit 2